MPLVINEVVSDIRIAPGQRESAQGQAPEANPERDRAERLMAALRREAARLSGRDEDDAQEASR